MGRWEDVATGFRFIAQELLDQLRADLPARERACQEREAQVRAEEQTRQERAAQLRADTAARQAKRAAATKKKAQPPQMVTPPAAPIAETGALNASPQAIALPTRHVAPNPRAETPVPAPMVAAQQVLF
jgi:glycerol-3-phosphate dehydrogenase